MNAPFAPPLLPEPASPADGPARHGPAPILCGEILPHELPRALDRCPQARVLSLDCFDTLIWRDTHAPVDIFAALPGVTPRQRRWAEATARRVARFGAGRLDVTIAEIYAELCRGPGLAPADAGRVAAAIAAECAAEARHSYAFAPAVALMRAARASGRMVIIVSDTYLDADQLRGLIADAAGEEVAALIDHVFCSSTYGRPKAAGLYRDVLAALPHAAAEILHIGDNKGADIDGLAPFGVHRLHLVQFTPAATRQLRLEAAVSAMIHPVPPAAAAIGDPAPTALQPHRAALALGLPGIADPGEALGFAVLGPVFHAFEHWLRAEAAALRARRGGRVHWLFLMRDGWLPLQVHAATGAAGDDPAHAIEISRFVATAAALAREGAALHHVLRETGAVPDALARQVLLPEADIARLTRHRTAEAAAMALIGEMRRPPRRRATMAAGAAMARRLVAHVRRIADPAPGDTLMLVDLGYNGTVQNRIDAILAEGLGVHVAGRYLLLREAESPALDKAGLIDARHYDAETLETLAGQVAVIEQLATTAMGSVIGYRDDGTPIRRANPIGAAQSAMRETVQRGAVAFAAAAGAAGVRGGADDAAARAGTEPAAQRRWREAAAASLARLMYFPCPGELTLLAGFEHDVNLGTARTVALFDPAAARAGLRQRGLFHLHGLERMFLAAELAEAGLPTRVAHFAMRRFATPFAFADFADGGIAVPVIFADAATGAATRETLIATPTHDGFHLAAIPLGDGRLGAALVLGALAEWVEIAGITLVPVGEFLAETPGGGGGGAALGATGDGMAEIAPGLWRSAHAGGFVFVQPPAIRPGATLMAAVAFRIIVPRG